MKRSSPDQLASDRWMMLDYVTLNREQLSFKIGAGPLRKTRHQSDSGV
jgi:hypothetical protein